MAVGKVYTKQKDIKLKENLPLLEFHERFSELDNQASHSQDPELHYEDYYQEFIGQGADFPSFVSDKV
ncbi:hypothetical protein [Candidatus Tisiphia endosymbiont of Beris chalybata]|uniref:hypothetical protein n=1 Tax=Candidatus Tisiphia endosymbiont of Beris chalybata TaxID=3066262 RepID=UPI00312C811C